jgi:hypothetical protein
MRGSRRILLLALAVVFAFGATLMPLIWSGLVQRRIDLAVQRAGGRVQYDCDGGIRNVLGRWIGWHYVGTISIATIDRCEDAAVAADLLENFRGLLSLKRLFIKNSKLDAGCWDRVGQLQSVRWLVVDADQYFLEPTYVPKQQTSVTPADRVVTGAMLDALSRMPALERLDLDDVELEAIALAEIPKFPALQVLNLKRTGITTADLAQLAGAASLKTVWVSQAILDDAQRLADVRQMLPGVTFKSD